MIPVLFGKCPPVCRRAPVYHRGTLVPVAAELGSVTQIAGRFITARTGQLPDCLSAKQNITGGQHLPSPDPVIKHDAL